MFALIEMARAVGDVEALAMIGPYKSRGKGHNKPFVKSCLSRASNRTGHTYPHDNVQERERHLWQNHQLFLRRFWQLNNMGFSS